MAAMLTVLICSRVATETRWCRSAAAPLDQKPSDQAIFSLAPVESLRNCAPVGGRCSSRTPLCSDLGGMMCLPCLRSATPLIARVVYPRALEVQTISQIGRLTSSATMTGVLRCFFLAFQPNTGNASCRRSRCPSAGIVSFSLEARDDGVSRYNEVDRNFISVPDRLAHGVGCSILPR